MPGRRPAQRHGPGLRARRRLQVPRRLGRRRRQPVGHGRAGEGPQDGAAGALERVVRGPVVAHGHGLAGPDDLGKEELYPVRSGLDRIPWRRKHGRRVAGGHRDRKHARIRDPAAGVQRRVEVEGDLAGVAGVGVGAHPGARHVRPGVAAGRIGVVLRRGRAGPVVAVAVQVDRAHLEVVEGLGRQPGHGIAAGVGLAGRAHGDVGPDVAVAAGVAVRNTRTWNFVIALPLCQGVSQARATEPGNLPVVALRLPGASGAAAGRRFATPGAARPVVKAGNLVAGAVLQPLRPVRRRRVASTLTVSPGRIAPALRSRAGDCLQGEGQAGAFGAGPVPRSPARGRPGPPPSRSP